jgi:histidinol-phosphatase (PHP family)
MRSFLDSHTHTLFSSDSSMPIVHGIKKAIKENLSGISFTDHYDFDIPTKGGFDFTFDIDLQQEEITKSINSTIIPDNFKILKGIEIGIQPQSIEAIEELMKVHTFDTVITSLHFIEGKDPYHGDYYIPYQYKEAYGKYLETILHCIEQFKDFDIIGHYDYIARYSPYKESTIYYKEFSDIFDSIFKILIEGGKTFEINTKTYRPFRGKEPLLDPDILKRYKELGGEGISFGSDAHDTSRIGENFEKMATIVKNCGIKYSVYYQNREANYLLID